MDDLTYQKLTDGVFAQVERAIDQADSEELDCDRASGVLTIVHKGQTLCVMNTQRPTQQIWLAALGRAWHFSFNGSSWQDDKGRGELFVTLQEILKPVDGGLRM